MRKLLAVMVAVLAVTLSAGLVSTAAGDGGPTANAAGKCKKKPGKKCKKKKKKKPPVVAPTVPPAVLSITPGTVAFPGTTHHGAECTTIADPDCPDQAFTVSNTGGSASTVPSPSIVMIQNGNVPVPGSRAGFKILANTCTAALAPGGTCSVTVTFTPESGGSFSGTLNVAGGSTAASASITGAAD